LRAFANQSEPIPSPPVRGSDSHKRLHPTTLAPHHRAVMAATQTDVIG
jgi:hypothetical protein